jgi:hypothetical protein
MVVKGKYVMEEIRLFSQPGALQAVTAICTFRFIKFQFNVTLSAV